MGKTSRKRKAKASQTAREIARQAAARGVTLVANATGHWMFTAGGRRVADYWPSTGTLRMDGANRKVATPQEALAAVLSQPAAGEPPPGRRRRDKVDSSGEAARQRRNLERQIVDNGPGETVRPTTSEAPHQQRREEPGTTQSATTLPRRRRKADQTSEEVAVLGRQHGIRLACDDTEFIGPDGQLLVSYRPAAREAWWDGIQRRAASLGEALAFAIAVLERDQWRAAIDATLPRTAPRAVLGVGLDAVESGWWQRALDEGKLVIEPCLPCASPLPDLWRRWCEARGRPCVIEDRSREFAR